ncbi:RE1, partial [Symbiodinium microadriaticum]
MSDMPARNPLIDRAASDENRAAEPDNGATVGATGDTAGRAEPSSTAVVQTSEIRREEAAAVNPFWSQKAIEETELAAARPAFLETSSGKASSGSTEMRRADDLPPQPEGIPESFGPSGPAVPIGTEGDLQDGSAEMPGLRAGERMVLTEMRNLMEVLINQNKALAAQNSTLQTRVDRLEEERSNSQAWRSAESAGVPEAFEGEPVLPSEAEIPSYQVNELTGHCLCWEIRQSLELRLVAFRISTARNQLHLDHRPNMSTVVEFMRVLQSEWEQVAVSGVDESSTKPPKAARVEVESSGEKGEKPGEKGEKGPKGNSKGYEGKGPKGGTKDQDNGSKSGGKRMMLMVQVGERIVPICPLGQLVDRLGCKVLWQAGTCRIVHPYRGIIEAELEGSCPVVDEALCLQLIGELETYQGRRLQQALSLKALSLGVAVESLEDVVCPWGSEKGLLTWLNTHCSEWPESLKMKAVPDRGDQSDEGVHRFLRLNRRHRKALKRATAIVLNLFSGGMKTVQFGDVGSGVVFLNIDMLLGRDLLDDSAYSWLAALCSSGKVCAVLAKPPSGSFQKRESDASAVRYLRGRSLVLHHLADEARNWSRKTPYASRAIDGISLCPAANVSGCTVMLLPPDDEDVDRPKFHVEKERSGEKYALEESERRATEKCDVDLKNQNALGRVKLVFVHARLFLMMMNFGHLGVEMLGRVKEWKGAIGDELSNVFDVHSAMKRRDEEYVRVLKESGVEVEILPAKALFHRKGGSGRHKCRVVACGNFSESAREKGRDKKVQCYAGGADSLSLRCHLRAAGYRAVRKGWRTSGSDVRTAFLLAPLRQPGKVTILRPPSVITQAGFSAPGELWEVTGALYGLQSSPAAWATFRDETLPTFEVNINEQITHLEQSKHDPNLWLLRSPTTAELLAILTIYVDDLLLSGTPEASTAIWKAIKEKWKISEPEFADEGQGITFCGFEIRQDDNGLHVGQSKYVQSLLDKYSAVTGVTSTPYAKESEPVCKPQDSLEKLRRAQGLVGELLWLATRTRADLVYGVSRIGQLITRDVDQAIQRAEDMIRYLRTTKHQEVRYGIPGEGHGPGSQLPIERDFNLIEVFADASFCPGSDRSQTGIVLMWGNAPIGWMS